ncbi:hypothetical protein SZN_33076 [Streptomyces zinciresistens K42]|uniref:Cytochrome c-type biogenesis protein n=1 Tax=Streptomyces zinciresistens K42 TaxID=700597 RepID=G2GM63_9ACTN|nr:cytochrome c-type biogenesis protein [Streptomyces zinciresistens]EGX55410.1 hypothetical protein SZN_33076 [Streptomyces zinciresistens K42]
MRSRLVGIGTLVAVLGLLAVAVTGLVVRDSGGEDRAYRLEQKLRCPVCKSVSIAESPAQTAQDMRAVVARQIAAGRTDQEIIDYFRSRYGDWVLLDPPASGTTLTLWWLPAGALVLGCVLLVRMRQRRVDGPREELTADQRERVDRALAAARARVEEESA